MENLQARLDKSSFHFVGNNLSVDFVNTRIFRNNQTVDLLDSLGDFVRWAQAAGIVDNAQAVKLRCQLRDEENTGARANDQPQLAQIHRFRDELNNLFHAAQNQIQIAPTQIALVNQVLQGQTGFTELAIAEANLVKRFHQKFDSPLQMLVPVAETAADLLCYADLARLKKCAESTCLLQFYDTTKNRTRRWCSDKMCGNRARANAFYQRRTKTNRD